MRKDKNPDAERCCLKVFHALPEWEHEMGSVGQSDMYVGGSNPPALPPKCWHRDMSHHTWLLKANLIMY